MMRANNKKILGVVFVVFLIVCSFPFFMTGNSTLPIDEINQLRSNDLKVSGNVKTFNSKKEPVFLKFTTPAQRVAVDRTDNLESLLYLGQGDKLVWVSVRENNESWRSLWRKYPKEMKKVKDILYRDNVLESIIMANPDLIIGWQSTFIESRLRDTGWWKKRGVKTYIVATSNSVQMESTIEDEIQYLEDMGKIFHKEAKVKKYIESVEKILCNKTPASKKINSAIVELRGRNIVNYNRKKLVGNMVEQLGGAVNISETHISPERLLEENPEVIFVVFLEDKDKSSIRKYFMGRQLESLQAVQNRRIYYVQLDYIYSPGFKIQEGLQMIKEGLYPNKNNHLIEKVI